jgi:hypothetical protein
MKGLWKLKVAGGVLIAAMVGLWLAFPWIAETGLERWLRQQGYEDVSIRIGRPSWNSLTLLGARFSHDLSHERVVIHIQDLRLEYGVMGLLNRRLDRMTLPKASILFERNAAQEVDFAETASSFDEGIGASPLNVLTLSDLAHGLPVLPFGEFLLGDLAISREDTTGPLRNVSVTGSMRQREEGLFAEFALRGDETQSYVLRMTDLNTQILSVQLEHQAQPMKPIAYWRSEADSTGNEIRLRGQIELDFERLAPLLAIPFPMGTDLQQVAGRVQASWVGTAPSATPLASVWHNQSTKVDGTVQGQVRLPEVRGMGKGVVLSVAGKFSGNPEQIHWVLNRGVVLSAAVDGKRVGMLRPIRNQLPVGWQPVRVAADADITGELYWGQSPIRYKMEGPLTVSFGAAASLWRLRFTMTHVVGLGMATPHVRGSFQFDGALPSSLVLALSAKEATADLMGVLEIEGERLKGRIEIPSTLAITDLSVNEFVMGSAKLRLSEPSPFVADLLSGQWQLNSSGLSLKAPEVRTKAGRMRADEISVQLGSASGAASLLSAKGTTTIRGLTALMGQQSLPACDVTLRFAIDGSTANAEVEARFQAIPVVAVAVVQQERETQRGTLHLMASPITFDRTNFRLRRLVTPWRYPFDITAGTVSGSVDVSWGPDRDGSDLALALRSASGEITLDRLAVQYRDTQISGLSATVAVRTEGRDRLVTVRPALLTIGSLNPGIEVTNMSFTVQGEWNRQEPWPVIEVREVKCELLGGALTSQGVRANPSRLPFSFTLLARRLDLQKVLSLEQHKGLEGTGILDGSLPVIVGGRGVTVTDGQLEARPPGGVIRYGATADASRAAMRANAHMDMVLQALNNFHYTVLHVGAQYAEDGMLRLRARLEGRNPDMKRSPPFHFNLTVQENIPALLKSLRLVQDIEESVQKKFVRPQAAGGG